MEWMNLIAGPTIGAAIGFFTNYIAVKMLFRPLKPKKLFGHQVPFTPGIIPKRKDSLAIAVGHAVGNNLLTKDDLAKLFLSEKMEDSIVQGIMNSILTDRVRTLDIDSLLPVMIGEEQYLEKKEFVIQYVCEKAISGIGKIDIGQIISEEGIKIVKRKGGMLAMLLKEDVITEIGQMLGEQVSDYIEIHGEEKLMPLVVGEVDSLTACTTVELLEKTGISEDKLRKVIADMYQAFVSTNLEKIIESINISEVVQSKIDTMEAEELERLVLSVMKKELNAIVYLGGVIGFLLGILNIFL